MLPSSTVENYLKAIYVGETHLVAGQKLVPMGQLAAALGIAPGTATTMVKALAESGLVTYEPYNGVRLTSAGEKLAARVLRRHRLIELVPGPGHGHELGRGPRRRRADGARRLGPADRAHRRNARRPEFDPHGDPIPTADGQLAQRALETLLTCPLNTPVTVARVTDQDAAFLRFIESHHLKPGQTIEVEERDEVSDSVRLKGRNDQRMTIGARAASKLLVTS